MIHEIYNFEETIREWFGDGMQPDPKAQDRADVCSGRISGHPCQFNYLGGWLVPEIVANTVKKWVEVKNKLDLHVEGEETLGHCEICACRLNLKIYVPRTTILNHSSIEPFKTKAPWCWLVTEETPPK